MLMKVICLCMPVQSTMKFGEPTNLYPSHVQNTVEAKSKREQELKYYDIKSGYLGPG